MQTADELTGLFRNQGLRVTPQRQAIFRLLHGNDRHPTVDSLYDAARTEMPTISLKTVYQTVHDLEALGQVACSTSAPAASASTRTSRPSTTISCASSCGLRARRPARPTVPTLPAAVPPRIHAPTPSR